MESVHSKISGIASSRTRGWQLNKKSHARKNEAMAVSSCRRVVVRVHTSNLSSELLSFIRRRLKYPCGRGNSAISDA